MLKNLRKLIVMVLALGAGTTAFSQISNSGIGAGITFQYGVNPKADYIAWNVESNSIPLYSASRFLVGPKIQFKNFQKIQGEIGLLYGNTSYSSNVNDGTILQDVRITEAQMPIEILYNARSPIKFHSAIVYHIGAIVNYYNIQEQGMIFQNYSFVSPSLSAGVRLATEMGKMGRVEYGLNYVRSLRSHHSFMYQNDDAAPAVASLMQKSGQLRLSLTYYFSPRVNKWSKKRYELPGLN